MTLEACTNSARTTLWVIGKIFTWQAVRCKCDTNVDYIKYALRTLSNDRHPAGRHSVFDGMMEVFGDWISKISQIDRWRLKLRSCCDQCLSNSLATKSPLKDSRKNIRLFSRNRSRVTREHQRASRLTRKLYCNS